MDTSVTMDRYCRAQDGFDAVAAAVPAEQWDTPSACAGWSNRDVLGHIVWGQELVRHLATGVPHESQVGAPGTLHPAALITGDPLRTWRAAREASLATLSPAALARTVALPVFGDAPLAVFITALTTDFLAHTWDIGHPAGLDVRLDADLLPAAFEWTRQNIIRRPGAIGPEITPPPGADEQTRFLAFLGRGANSHPLRA